MKLTRWDPFREMTRWDPFRDIEELTTRLRTLGQGIVPETGRQALVEAEWAPLVDIHETDAEFLIKAELPEVKKEDVRVEIENGVLIIEGERKLEKEEKGKTFRRMERSFGKFVRSFTVPTNVEEKKVTAEFKEGVLYVHVPKTEAAKPKLIEVKVA
jgi:HSP20 family protein